MESAQRSISVATLAQQLWSERAPLVLDVRREADFVTGGKVIPGSVRRPPDMIATWALALPRRPLVVYCAHGRAVSHGACDRLLQLGHEAIFLEGGYSAWESSGLPILRWRPPLSEQPSRWITRERPKIDRIACPWLVSRFIDPTAEFRYVPTAKVREQARSENAVPYDIPEVEFSHVGPLCSFDAFLKLFELKAPGLDRLATIVRGADTARLDLSPVAPGLLAVSLGLSLNFPDDHQMLSHGMVVYDALYAWCRFGQGEGHDWKPEAMAVRA